MIRLPASLRWRLLLLSVLVVAPALLWLAWQLSWEFENSVEQRVHQELDNHMKQLLARLRPAADGHLALTGQLSDPRFNTPLSGLYWQINDASGKVLLRSRSLWDSQLDLTPAMLRHDGVHEYVLKGPRGETLFALIRGVWIDLPPAAGASTAPAPADAATTRTNGPDARRYIITLALDHAEISAAKRLFNWQLALGLLLLGIILAATFIAQVVWGLRPLQALRQQLEDIRRGHGRKLSGTGIAELQPLVEELNKLLATHEQKVEDARARAANLAHGMKTPLTVLGALARDLRRQGLHEQAREMEDQIGQLRRHIEHELARSKIHGGGASPPQTPVARPLTGIVRALRAGNDAVRWQLAVAEDARVPMEQGDFMELAGNLLENAAKWANGTVRVRFGRDDAGHPRLLVEDDGPGVPPEHHATILQRGARLDESTHGNGLGLAIVRDILDSYGYDLRFYRAELGGLGVAVSFRRQPAREARQAPLNRG